MSQLSLDETAERIGNYVWIEARLFEILGGWVQGVPEPEVKEFLAEQSHHHAWHMQMWRERLPRLRERDVDALVRAADPGVDVLMEAISGSTAPESTIEKLVGVYRVVIPWMIGTYSRHRDRCAPAADRPVMRVLDLVVSDELEDLRRGEMMIQSLLVASSLGASSEGEEAIRRAHDHAMSLEAILVGMGGIVGNDI